MMITKKISPEETKPLRHLVLWPHIELTENCVIDIDHREDAIHLGTVRDNKLVSICSLFQMTNHKLDHKTQYRLRAMATDPESRGLKAGKHLVEAAIRLLCEKGVDVLWCDAREVALGFYEKLGFQIKGDFYHVKNVGPHKLMYFEI